MDKGILERQCKMFGSNIGSSSVSIEALRIQIVCNIWMGLMEMLIDGDIYG